uniref:Major capsid protein L1 n=1 Tax=Rangifer tarandus granti papillomavirus TaxID=1489729 RepID=A0A077D6V2_9PAPI|nr:L1 protein [Rangifer tarandus granti papillomavirus]
MALWQQNQKLFLPPVPVTKVLCTETYVKRRNIFYHGETERLLTVGHPFFKVEDKKIPKVSSNQYRVFRVRLPDPNQFALPDQSLHNPEKERLVWTVTGVQVSRGQPLYGAVSGHPLFNFFQDAENLGRRKPDKVTTDSRKMSGLDVKQQQLLLVGCAPPLGEYWDKALPCSDDHRDPGDCPPIELKTKVIEDGDMMEIGWGAANFKELNANKADVPLDLVNEICLYPDYLKMTEEATGNRLFFFARREQSYIRHVYTRSGKETEAIPTDHKFLSDTYANNPAHFYGVPSGSLVTTEGQIFNRPYWLYQAQGMNNGVCWNNNLFITVGDNTRGGNLAISIGANGKAPDSYDDTAINLYQRHVEEYKLAIIVELCSVELTAETVAHLQAMNPDVLQTWEINMQPPPSSVLENTYRFASGATKCQTPASADETKDPYDGYTFWEVDLREKLSLDLDQFQLGRRFLATQGLGCSIRKRKVGQSSSRNGSSTKRRRAGR